MFYANKKILVTGATGLIGANLIEELVRRGAQVRGVLHRRAPVIIDRSIQYVHLDLTRPGDCAAAVEGMDYVFHCAAHTFGAQAMADNPMGLITPNVLMNTQLVEAAYLARIDRYLLISSSTVYPALERPMLEEEAFQGEPHESYFAPGWMKRYAEKVAEFYHRRYGMQIAVLRPTNVYGPYDKFDFATSHVLPALIRRAIERRNPFEVWGDGTAVREFIYASDMVEAMLLALEKHPVCEAINIGSGDPVTIRESVYKILRLSHHDQARVIFDASKPTTIPLRLVDLTRARTILGYAPKISFDEGLQRTIDWYRGEAAQARAS